MIKVDIKIQFIQEHECQFLMDAADMIDRGKKVFCILDFINPALSTIDLTLQTEEAINDVVKTLLNISELNKKKNPIKPVFALVEGDNGYVGLYWREGIHSISNGKQWSLYYRFIEEYLSMMGYNPKVEINDDMTVKNISLLNTENETSIMNNLNETVYGGK